MASDHNILEISTDEHTNYKFYPVTTGSVRFQVKCANDARIGLTEEPFEEGFCVEVLFGGWNNTRSAIMRDRDDQIHSEVQTPGIVSSDEFRGFWVHWAKGIIRAGREGETTALLTWEDPKPFPMAYVGVSTGRGSSGLWKFEGSTEELYTPDDLEFKFQPVLAGFLEFEFRGPHDCHVALAPGPAINEVMYEVIIGGWGNKWSAFQYTRRGKKNEVKVETPNLCDPKQFKKFVIEWQRGLLKVRDEKNKVFMEWQDEAPSFLISHFGVRTSQGATGDWRISTVPTSA